MSFDLASPCSSAGIWTSMISRRSNGTTNPPPEPSASNRADDRRRAAFQDAEDASFGAAIGDAFDARDDAVAVHGLIQVAAGDVDVARHALRGTIRHDEAEPARVRGDPADDQVHTIGQPVTVAAGLDQVSRPDEILEQALEGRALLARYLQSLLELPRRRRVLDFLANQLRELFVVQHCFILVGGRLLCRQGPRAGTLKGDITSMSPQCKFFRYIVQPPDPCLSLLTV